MTESRPAGIPETDFYATRAFNAPRDVVFRFFTEPEHLVKWFGPEGFHVPIERVVVEPRVGGRWNLTMVDDSANHEFTLLATITEFEEPELLVITITAETGAGPLEKVLLRLRFHDHGARTRITLHQGPFTAEAREMTAGGWERSFARLDALFATDPEETT